MNVVIEDCPAMAKKKGISVQIDDDVVVAARVVSAMTGKPMSVLISDILRPILARMEREETARRNKPRKPKGGE